MADINITLRDYFAAQAPADPPSWFTVPAQPFEAPPVPPSPAFTLDDMVSDDRARRTCRDWFRDGDFDLEDAIGVPLPPDVVAWRDSVGAYHEAMERRGEARYAHDAAQKRARYIAWRWAYADLMLAARDGAERATNPSEVA